MSLREQVEEILEHRIRPMVRLHAGGIELVEADDATGVVKVRFQGTCVGCPLANLTLRAGVESELMEQVPAVKELLAVDEHGEVLAI